MNTNTNERKYTTFNKTNNYNINTNIVHNSKNISFPKIYINHNKLTIINYLITNNLMVKHIIIKNIFIQGETPKQTTKLMKYQINLL